MLQIAAFTFNPFQENTYVIINEKKECWFVDPGMQGEHEVQQMLNFVTNEKLIPQQIINTHTHIDHILGIKALQDQYKIPFGMHEKDMPVLHNAKGSAMMFGFELKEAPQPDFFIKEQEPLALGEDLLEVRFTPGHSPGSIIFYHAAGGWVISGDVLFQGSVGRTDLPGGNMDILMKSITEQMYTLPESTVVFSGHGPQTTIGHEKQYNPFIKG
jgi:hydroxyacylglutathione hydrolase